MKKVRLILLSVLLLGLTSAMAQDVAEKTETATPIKKTTVRYYYYPNLLAYYDNKEKVYHLRKNGQWFTAPDIPSGFAGYSMYNRINVAIDDYDDDNITQFLDVHRKKFPYVPPSKAKTMAPVTN